MPTSRVASRSHGVAEFGAGQGQVGLEHDEAIHLLADLLEGVPLLLLAPFWPVLDLLPIHFRKFFTSLMIDPLCFQEYHIILWNFHG